MDSGYERWRKSRSGRLVICMMIYALTALFLRAVIGAPFSVSVGIGIGVMVSTNFILSDFVRKNPRVAKILSFGRSQ